MRRLSLALAGTIVAAASAFAMPSAAQTTAPITYTLEQLQTGPLPQALRQQLGPLNTIPEIETLLKQNRIAFSWRIAEINTDQIAPAIARQIAALPPKQVFVLPSAQGVTIGLVIARR